MHVLWVGGRIDGRSRPASSNLRAAAPLQLPNGQSMFRVQRRSVSRRRVFRAHDSQRPRRCHTQKEIAKPQIQTMFRAPTKPAKRGYAKASLEAITVVDKVTEAGAFYLGRTPAIRIDNVRMERAATRYIRGLYRYETGNRLQPSLRLKVITDPRACATFGDRLIDMIRRDGVTRLIQQGVFSYHYANHPTIPDGSIWVMLFFDAYPVVARIGELTPSVTVPA